MSLTATLPVVCLPVNPVLPVAYTTSRLSGVTLHNPSRTLGLRWLEVAAFEAAAGRITPVELAFLETHVAEINAELDRMQVRNELRHMTSSDYRALGKAAFETWQHSRFARSTKRARKTAATCGNCRRMGRPCAWHQGGAK